MRVALPPSLWLVGFPPPRIITLMIITTATITEQVGHAGPCAGLCTPGLTAVGPALGPHTPEQLSSAPRGPWGQSGRMFSLLAAALSLFHR